MKATLTEIICRLESLKRDALCDVNNGYIGTKHQKSMLEVGNLHLAISLLKGVRDSEDEVIKNNIEA